jgi:hypothetical protein
MLSLTQWKGWGIRTCKNYQTTYSSVQKMIFLASYFHSIKETKIKWTLQNENEDDVTDSENGQGKHGNSNAAVPGAHGKQRRVETWLEK